MADKCPDCQHSLMDEGKRIFFPPRKLLEKDKKELKNNYSVNYMDALDKYSLGFTHIPQRCKNCGQIAFAFLLGDHTSETKAD